MGDRANIKMVYEDESVIYFYTHWGGSALPQDLRNALIRGKSRWDNEPYLARIIFSEMIQNEVLDEAGYGISTYECDNEHPIIVVNPSEQTVETQEVKWSFDEFVGINVDVDVPGF